MSLAARAGSELQPTSGNCLSQDPSNLNELVSQLKQRVQDTEFPGFRAVRVKPEFLEKFLRVKDGDVEAALNAMKKYYANLHKNRRNISGIRPLDYERVYKSGAILLLRHDFQGVKVIVQRWCYWKPKDFELSSLINATGLLAEACLQSPLTQKHGIAVVLDLKGFGMRHALKINPAEAFRGIDSCLNGLPARVKGVHFLHPPSVFWPIHMIVLSLLQEKLKKRIHVHYSAQSLHQYFAKEMLPLS